MLNLSWESSKQTMLHTMHLNAEPFRKIADGSKTIELRLYDERRRQLQTGHTIEFLGESGSLLVLVTALHVFSDFAELYSELDMTKCGYSAKQAISASPDDMLCFYSRAQQRKWGVVGIEFRLLSVTRR